MAGPTIDDIVKAIAGANNREIKKLKAALSRKGISLGDDDDDSKNESRGSKYKQSFKSNLEDELRKTGEGAKKALKDALSSVKGPVDEVLGPFSALNEHIRELRTQAELFTKAGYDRALYNFDDAISAAAKRSLKLTGNLRAQRDATDSLMRGFQAAAFTTNSFREEIFAAATTLQAAGFDTDAYASIVDTATMSFNMSEKQIRSLTSNLVDLQKQFALNPKKMMQDYDYFAKNFAYSTTRLNENFAKLQKMSRITGVDFRKLTESFGENMDSFKSSAEMAGGLNQILGKSIFNSIDLLGKNEAERAEVIREGLQKRFGSRIRNLEKFELKAIAAQLKMSPDEAKRFLRGEAPKAAKGLGDLAAKSKDPASIMARMSGNLEQEMKGLNERIRRFQRPYERSMIELTDSFRRGIETGTAFQEGLSKTVDKMSGAILGPGQRLGLSGPDEIKNIKNLLESSGRTLASAGGVVSKAAEGMGEIMKGILTMANSLAGKLGDKNRAETIAGTLEGQGGPKTITPKPAQISTESQKGIGTAVATALNGINITLQLPGPLGNNASGAPTSIVGKLQIEDFNLGSQQ